MVWKRSQSEFKGIVSLARQPSFCEKLIHVWPSHSAEGNMLIRLSPPNSNPAQALIKALNSMPPSQSHNPIPSQAKSASAGISAGKLNKEEEFFMALWSEAGEAGSKRMIMNQVTRILSGDPSKGALSLEMTESLRVGQKVQVG